MTINEIFTWEGNYVCPNCHERRQGDDVEMTMHIVLCPPRPFPQYATVTIPLVEEKPLSERFYRAILTRMKWFINFFCWKRKLMAILEDIGAEVDVVSAKLDAIAAEVSALKAQVAAGSAVTPDQLQALLDRVKSVVVKEDALLAPDAPPVVAPPEE